jgi:hypothetical protein
LEDFPLNVNPGQFTSNVGPDLLARVREELHRQPRDLSFAGLLRSLLSNWLADMEAARASGDPRARPVQAPQPVKPRQRERRSKPKPKAGKKEGGDNGKPE